MINDKQGVQGVIPTQGQKFTGQGDTGLFSNVFGGIMSALGQRTAG